MHASTGACTTRLAQCNAAYTAAKRRTRLVPPGWAVCRRLACRCRCKVVTTRPAASTWANATAAARTASNTPTAVAVDGPADAAAVPLTAPRMPPPCRRRQQCRLVHLATALQRELPCWSEQPSAPGIPTPAGRVLLWSLPQLQPAVGRMRAPGHHRCAQRVLMTRGCRRLEEAEVHGVTWSYMLQRVTWRQLEEAELHVRSVGIRRK